MARKKNKAGLKAADLKHYRKMLLTKRAELLGNVISMENDALHHESSELSKMPFHMADLGTDNYEQEFTLGLAEGERKVLKEIDYALVRMENGTYGMCEGTNKPIERGRLDAIPWMRYSVEYARMIEKGLAEPIEPWEEENGVSSDDD